MVVLCGGLGTRLGAMTHKVPKPLLPIGGSPFLLRLLLQWRKEGIQRFILSTHHLPEEFEAFVRQYRDAIGKVEVVFEKEALGTGGGLKLAAQSVETSSFFAANGDSYAASPLTTLLNAHIEGKCPMTILAVPAANVLRGAKQKGSLAIDSSGKLQGLTTLEEIGAGWINAGNYVIDRKETERWPHGKFSLEECVLGRGDEYPIKVLQSETKLLDIGRPDCYSYFDEGLGKVENLFANVERL